ncbi:hypothetical protein KAT51_00985 [bacterium]|nr:hypothetical protein [bacterium]
MSVGETLAPATGMLTSGLKSVVNYSWILWCFLGVLVCIILFVVWRVFVGKKQQWTHKLRIRRVGQNGFMEEPFYIQMRRFPVIKGAEIFELENPLLGGYLMPSLNEYTSMNEFSIILDKNNRIYTNTGEKWCPNKKSADVSGQHAEIDIARSGLKDDWQKINKVSDRIEWSTIAKYAFLGVLVMGAVVLGIVGLQNWSDSHTEKAKEAAAMERAMGNLADAMETIQATVNTQQLLIPELKELKGTNNLQGIINLRSNNETS